MDPEFGLALYNQGLAYALKGMSRETIAAARRAAPAFGADSKQVNFLLAIGHALAGEEAQARRILPELEAEAATHGAAATVHLFLGEEEEALDWLERALVNRAPYLPSSTSEPWYDPLREHPRFRELRRAMALEAADSLSARRSAPSDGR